ncbi:homeobox domain-containing protein [Ditylenchus destructor]|uniref:Homeobox domain-containing protein n=1 Tax=Ditylenchus destructor TaxID=166010 RepID=A0AAD4N6T3_9BILA|nr:homeobox domain-containing protein [Ditylenchus destructor]
MYSSESLPFEPSITIGTNGTVEDNGTAQMFASSSWPLSTSIPQPMLNPQVYCTSTNTFFPAPIAVSANATAVRYGRSMATLSGLLSTQPFHPHTVLPNAVSSFYPGMGTVGMFHTGATGSYSGATPHFQSKATPNFTPDAPQDPAPLDSTSCSISSDRGSKKRILFSREQTNELEAFYVRKRFISTSERNALANRTGLSSTQVKIWFQNRRYKNRKVEKDLKFLASKEERQPSNNAITMEATRSIKFEIETEVNGSEQKIENNAIIPTIQPAGNGIWNDQYGHHQNGHNANLFRGNNIYNNFYHPYLYRTDFY